MRTKNHLRFPSLTVFFGLAFIALLSVSCSTETSSGESSSTETTTIDFDLIGIENTGFVTDQENILTEEEEKNLSAVLQDFRDRTSCEIVVVTIDSIHEGESMVDYAVTLGDRWGVGDAEKNNGALMLVSRRMKDVFIATGRGTEKVVTDLCVKNIIIRELIPSFKEDRFAEGIRKGVDRLMQEMEMVTWPPIAGGPEEAESAWSNAKNVIWLNESRSSDGSLVVRRGSSSGVIFRFDYFPSNDSVLIINHTDDYYLARRTWLGHFDSTYVVLTYSCGKECIGMKVHYPSSKNQESRTFVNVLKSDFQRHFIVHADEGRSTVYIKSIRSNRTEKLPINLCVEIATPRLAIADPKIDGDVLSFHYANGDCKSAFFTYDISSW